MIVTCSLVSGSVLGTRIEWNNLREEQKIVDEEYEQDSHTLWYPGPIPALQQLDNLTIPPAA